MRRFTVDAAARWLCIAKWSATSPTRNGTGPAPPGPLRRRGGRSRLAELHLHGRSSEIRLHQRVHGFRPQQRRRATPSCASPPRSTTSTRRVSRAVPSSRAPARSYVDFCEIERASADQIDDTHAIVARWREFIEPVRADSCRASPSTSAWTPAASSPAQKLMQRDARGRGQRRRVRVALPALRRQPGRHPGRHEPRRPQDRRTVPSTARSCRSTPAARSQWPESLGWYVGGAPVEIPAAQLSDFRSALEVVRTALRAGRPLTRVPIARVLRLLGPEFHPTSPDLYSIVSFVDARSIPGSERWTELKAYGLLRVSYGDQVCVWINRLHEGLQFASRYPDTDTAYKNMRLYVEGLRSIIVSVARHGPHTPLWPQPRVAARAS